jgi:hypothetical protein
MHVSCSRYNVHSSLFHLISDILKFEGVLSFLNVMGVNGAGSIFVSFVVVVLPLRFGCRGWLGADGRHD